MPARVSRAGASVRPTAGRRACSGTRWGDKGDGRGRAGTRPPAPARGGPRAGKAVLFRNGRERLRSAVPRAACIPPFNKHMRNSARYRDQWNGPDLYRTSVSRVTRKGARSGSEKPNTATLRHNMPALVVAMSAAAGLLIVPRAGSWVLGYAPCGNGPSGRCIYISDR